MIDNTVLTQLEFDKVLKFISRNAYTKRGLMKIENSRPFIDKEKLLIEGQRVTEARDLLLKFDYPPFLALPDLTEELTRSRIDNASLDIEIILQIKDLAESCRKLYSYFSSKLNDKSSLYEISSKLFVDKTFEYHISQIFNSKNQVKDSASPKLAQIRQTIIEKNSQLTRVVNSILKKLSSESIVQENFITLTEGRIVLPVKVEHKRHVKGFIHSESATGQTVYIEPTETLDLNNEIMSLHFEEKREIERILRELTKKIADVSEELIYSLNLIAHLDAIFSKAKYSIETIGGFPSFDKNKPFEILSGRHPILLKKIGKHKTVPLNIKIDDNRIIIITGPNAGGKTVVLKTIGLLSLLALSGFHIPIDPDSNFHFFEEILIDIGDKQSIEDDLSTFSWHLKNIKNILDNSNENSLVLLDEIGTGTDPSEGAAIASTVLGELNKNGSVVLCSTHHGNLKITANQTSGFENASMEFDTDNLIPTYKFVQGIPGSSYAFEVAQRIGYDDSFIVDAKNSLDINKNKIEDFLLDLEKKSNDYKMKLSKLEIENSRLVGLTKLYEEKVNKLKKQKSDILRETKNKAESYLNDVNKQVEKAIKNIKESKADKKTIKEEKVRINNLKEKTKKIIEDKQPKEPEKPFEIGDFVGIIDTSTTGTITAIDNNKKICVIESGAIKLNVPLKNLSHEKKKKRKVQHERLAYNFSTNLDSLTLDIRGSKPEEAEYKIIKFLDDAYASSNNRVEILHGKGTGALKNTVWTIIKASDLIKKYYFADIEYGGEGITVVEFK